MTVLGNIPARTYSDIVTDFFQGDGVSTSFQLSRTPPNQSGLDVSIEGIVQPANCFSLNNNTLTFVEAPPITDPERIAVVHRYGLPLNVGQVPNGSVVRNTIATGAVGPDAFTSVPDELDTIFNTFRDNVGTTHSVYRSVKGKLNDSINIKDFGAVCDGVTDDTTAVMNAIQDSKNLVITGPTRIKTPSSINFTEDMVVMFAPGGKLMPDFSGIYFSEVQDRGTGFNQVPVINVIPANSDGQNAQLKVHMEIETFTIGNVGANYHVGDTITITGGVFIHPIIFVVTTVGNNGAITSFTVQSRGDYTVLPTSPVIQGSTSGAGTNASFSITSWRVHSNEILNPGVGYTQTPQLQYVGGGGTGASSIAYGSPIGMDAGIIAGDYEIFSLLHGGNYVGKFGYTEISPKWFGAVGDGVVDDTNALQVTLNSSENIKMPKGTYLISSPLKVKHNQSIIGSTDTLIQSKNSFIGYSMVQNFLPNIINLGTLDNGLVSTNNIIKIENISFNNQTSNNPQTVVVNLVDIGRGSVIKDCFINGGGVSVVNGSMNAIRIRNNHPGQGIIIDNTNIGGFYSNNIIDIVGGSVLVNRISAKNSSASVLSIVSSLNVEIDGCVFDGLDTAVSPLGGIVIQDCTNGTIKNTRILNKGNQALFPAIYFQGIGTGVRNYSVEQVLFADSVFPGNFLVNIQDDNTNSTVAGIASELIRYNRYEVLAPGFTLYGRGEFLSNGIGGFVGKLPVAQTFSNSVPLLLPYKLDVGNHCVEVLVSGRNITNNMPFAAKVILMNADNGSGSNPADAHILYFYNNPGNLGLSYDNSQKAYSLTLDSGTVYNVSATVVGNGVYTTSFGY